MEGVTNWLRLRNHSNRLRGQFGQAITEYILLLVIVLGIFAVVRSGLLQAELAQTFTQKAWGRIDTMVQCGAWAEECLESLHPESSPRVISLKPL